MAEAGALAAWQVPARASALVAAGREILNLTIGDPEGPPHPAIVRAVGEALAAGRTHYSPLGGEPKLRRAIGRWLGVPEAAVTVMPGAQAAVFAAVQITAGPGDEVILTDPHYATYPGVVAASGARAVAVPVRAGDFGLDREAIAGAVTPATRAILVASPANPTGAALAPEDFAFLRALCDRADLWLLVDETYARFAFARPHVSALAEGPVGRTITIGTLSKSHAMTGFRLGWAVAPAEATAALEEWCAAATFGVSQFIQDAAVAALQVPEAELLPWRRSFRARAALVVDRVNRIPGLCARMPDGGMFVMADARAVGADDVALALRLLEETGVALLPGSGFGRGGAGHLRISLTPSEETLARALDRLARALSRV